MIVCFRGTVLVELYRRCQIFERVFGHRDNSIAPAELSAATLVCKDGFETQLGSRRPRQVLPSLPIGVSFFLI